MAAYEREIEAGTARASTTELLATARQLAARRHAALAMRAARRGEATVAQHELELARRHGAHLVAVRRATAEVQPLLERVARAEELRIAAAARMDDDIEGAFELISEARALRPLDPEIGRLHRDATRRLNAERALTRATAAWARGDSDEAARQLVGANVRGRPLAGATALRAEIGRSLLTRASTGDATAAREAQRLGVAFDLPVSVRNELAVWQARHLLTRAAKLRNEGLGSVAALLELEAERLVPEAATPSLDEARARAGVVVAVHPFTDETGGRVDARRVAQDLVTRLDADDGGPALRPELGASVPPEGLWVRGAAVETHVERLRERNSTRSVRFLAGTRAVENPASESWLRELAAVAEERELRDLELEAARDLLERLEAVPFVDRPVVRRARRGELEFRTRIAEAESRVRTLEREVQRLDGHALRLQEALRNTPDELEEPVFEVHQLPVRSWDSVAKLTVRVTVGRGDEVLLEQNLAGTHRHTEHVAPAFPRGDVPEDPDESPTEAELAERAVADWLDLVARRVQGLAVDAALPLLASAREAEQAGRSTQAAERYARYLLGTPDVPSAERAAAARALRELVGVEVALRAEPTRSPR